MKILRFSTAISLVSILFVSINDSKDRNTHHLLPTNAQIVSDKSELGSEINSTNIFVQGVIFPDPPPTDQLSADHLALFLSYQ